MKLAWPDGITAEIFVRDYWQKKALLFRAALPEFENPITPDELAGLALDEDVSSRIIVKGEDGSWHCHHGPFEEDELEKLPAEDWSMLVTDVDKVLPEFRAYLEPFSFIPSWRIDDLMISYAPAGASVGAHVDNYDVFLFQAVGRREWSISEDPNADLSYIPDQDIRILANFEPENTWILEPGDMLYLPPGAPHHGVSLDDECMTWSVGFRAPAHNEIVADIAQALTKTLSDDLRYVDPGFNLQSEPGEISNEALTRFREIWDEHVNPDARSFEQIIGKVLTERKSNENDDTSASEQIVQEDQDLSRVLLAEEGGWERNSQSRLSFIKQSDGQADLFADGTSFVCSHETATLLTGQVYFESEQLAQLVNDGDVLR